MELLLRISSWEWLSLVFFLDRIRNLTNLRFVSVVGCVCVNLCVFFVEWKNEAGELSEVLTIESVCVIVN